MFCFPEIPLIFTHTRHDTRQLSFFLNGTKEIFSPNVGTHASLLLRRKISHYVHLSAARVRSQELGVRVMCFNRHTRSAPQFSNISSKSWSINSEFLKILYFSGFQEFFKISGIFLGIVLGILLLFSPEYHQYLENWQPV